MFTGQERTPRPPTPAALESRMSSMQGTLAIQESLTRLSQQPAPSARPKLLGPPPGLESQPRLQHHGLEPRHSRREQGGDQADGRLTHGRSLKNARCCSGEQPSFPVGGRGREGEVAETAAPMEKAVVQLKIVRSIAGDWAKGRDLNRLLDRAETGGAEVSSSSGRSKAVAYRNLRGWLKENPSFLYEVVEALMAEDFHLCRSTPALSCVPVSSRGWIEHRSRIGPFPGSIRACTLDSCGHS